MRRQGIPHTRLGEDADIATRSENSGLICFISYNMP